MSRRQTAKRVIDAARELGLRRILPLPHRRVLRFEVLLAHPHPSFLTRLNHGFASLAATLDHSVVVQRTIMSRWNRRASRTASAAKVGRTDRPSRRRMPMSATRSSR